jgi:hypothetical protein
MLLNGIDVSSGKMSFTKHGWDLDFTLDEDAQFAERARIVVKIGERLFEGHIIEYSDTQGKARCGKSSIYETVTARWVDASLASVVKLVGAQTDLSNVKIEVDWEGKSRLEVVKRIASLCGIEWYVSDDGDLFFGDVKLDTPSTTPISKDPDVYEGLVRTSSCVYDVASDRTEVHEDSILDTFMTCVRRSSEQCKLRMGTMTGSKSCQLDNGAHVGTVHFAWGIPGMTPVFRNGARVAVLLHGGRAIVVGWESSDIESLAIGGNSLTVGGGMIPLALATPLSIAINTMVTTFNTHTHFKVVGPPPSDPTSVPNALMVPLSGIDSIVKAR